MKYKILFRLVDKGEDVKECLMTSPPAVVMEDIIFNKNSETFDGLGEVAKAIGGLRKERPYLFGDGQRNIIHIVPITEEDLERELKT